MTKVALTIGGSDSGGGAGIQADLKTFALHCVHGTSAIVCVTAQNTVGVTKVETLETSTIKAQIEAVATDFRVDAVKTGMLPDCEIVEAVADRLKQAQFSSLVVDPVMVSRAGAKLIDDKAIALVKQQLIPQAVIVTPNRYEAEILSGLQITTLEQLQQAAISIHETLGAKVVLAKGGSLRGTSRGTDIWYDGKEVRVLTEREILTQNTHGTGCTLSAAICANLALGHDLWTSVVSAKKYVTQALENSLDLGEGSGPVGHYFPLLKANRV
ncbi:MAG: bifunctional hydroxymethylpyrimidine kinase/phosphomethylpyrimidine kinase [Cyanobacteria bacterium P01_G01_bin.19]